MKIKIENILFWIAILLIIALAIWKLIGSPTDTNSLVSIALFIASAVILLWQVSFNTEKKIMKVENKTTIGFINVKHELEKINDKLNNIENLIKKKK